MPKCSVAKPPIDRPQTCAFGALMWTSTSRMSSRARACEYFSDRRARRRADSRAREGETAVVAREKNRICGSQLRWSLAYSCTKTSGVPAAFLVVEADAVVRGRGIAPADETASWSP